MTTFSATVESWALRVKDAAELIFKESCSELVEQLNALVPVDSGFLRASLQASTSEMPRLTRAKPDGGTVFVPDGTIELVIVGADIGDVLYLGYTANYGLYVAMGANGRAPRPWVDMVAQRWQQIVSDKTIEVRRRLGL